MNGNPKKGPAVEALDRIREAEERARTIVREAREITSVQVVKEAAEVAEKATAKSLAEAKKQADARKKSILESAHREAEAIRAETEADLSALRRQAGAELDRAVKKVSLKIQEFLKGESA